MAARRRVSRRRRRTTRKVTKRRRTIKKRVTKKRRKARKPVKKEFGSMKSVWEGKAKKTKKDNMTKRSLMMKDGKVVAKKSVVGSRIQVFRGTKERTAGGLTKKDLMKNKHGKVIFTFFQTFLIKPEIPPF